MQTEYDQHTAAIEAAFAYLRSRKAIAKLAEPCPVWGRIGACFWLPAAQSCLAPKSVKDVELVPTPTVRFVRCWPPTPPVKQSAVVKSLLTATPLLDRLAHWFRRNLI